MNIPHNVIGAVLDSSRFSFNKQAKQFTAFESDVTGLVLRRLWDDSADTGFGIMSKQTGKIVYFTLHSTVRESDGCDIVGWKFVVYNPRNEANLVGLTVMIYND